MCLWHHNGLRDGSCGYDRSARPSLRSATAAPDLGRSARRTRPRSVVERRPRSAPRRRAWRQSRLRGAAWGPRAPHTWPRRASIRHHSSSGSKLMIRRSSGRRNRRNTAPTPPVNFWVYFDTALALMNSPRHSLIYFTAGCNATTTPTIRIIDPNSNSAPTRSDYASRGSSS